MRRMALTDWPEYWMTHGWAQVGLFIATFALFCLARLIPRAFAAIDYAVHFHGTHSARDGAQSLPPGHPVPVPYRASLRVMNTSGRDLTAPDLPDGAVITVRPKPDLLIALATSTTVPRATLSTEPVDPARVAVTAQRLRPGDWIDVDLLTDRPVYVDSLRAHVTGRRTRPPRRRRLRYFDRAQLTADLIGLPLAVAAMVVVGNGLLRYSGTALDAAARYGWLFLALWAVMSLWGVMDQVVRYATRRRWRGHPRLTQGWSPSQ
jgi:hypothetical protein